MDSIVTLAGATSGRPPAHSRNVLQVARHSSALRRHGPGDDETPMFLRHLPDLLEDLPDVRIVANGGETQEPWRPVMAFRRSPAWAYVS